MYYAHTVLFAFEDVGAKRDDLNISLEQKAQDTQQIKCH